MILSGSLVLLFITLISNDPAVINRRLRSREEADAAERRAFRQKHLGPVLQGVCPVCTGIVTTLRLDISGSWEGRDIDTGRGTGGHIYSARCQNCHTRLSAYAIIGESSTNLIWLTKEQGRSRQPPAGDRPKAPPEEQR